jgi:hypothetical protein
MTHKKITWASWNNIAEEYMSSLYEDMKAAEEDLSEMMANQEMPPLVPFVERSQSNIIHTPWGPYSMESMFKPSSRWDCWIGTTNFSITKKIKSILINDIEGIEALRILGRYTFAVGIPISFSFRDVRIDIEKKLCVYTEQEILTEDTKATVDLVKDQLKNKKYWSILVAPTGKVDYVVSDKLDQNYLDGLNELVELKQMLGGIILRGDNG